MRVEQSDRFRLAVAVNHAKASAIPVARIKRNANQKQGGGSSDWTRTSNHSINSRVLCQLSYGGISAIGRSPRRDYQIAQATL